MPLLHIAGVTGANKTFSLAFCFLAEETQPYYKWALECLLNILTSNQIPLPGVVITNREQALINSLQTTFPDAYHMLCLWHIEKNLVTNGAKHIKNKISEHKMIEHWDRVVQLTSPSDFNSAFSSFSSCYGAQFEKYMNSTWLPVAEKYANAWTKSVTHFDH
jgi:hypothetical protein